MDRMTAIRRFLALVIVATIITGSFKVVRILESHEASRQENKFQPQPVDAPYERIGVLITAQSGSTMEARHRQLFGRPTLAGILHRIPDQVN